MKLHETKRPGYIVPLTHARPYPSRGWGWGGYMALLAGFSRMLSGSAGLQYLISNVYTVENSKDSYIGRGTKPLQNPTYLTRLGVEAKPRARVTPAVSALTLHNPLVPKKRNQTLYKPLRLRIKLQIWDTPEKTWCLSQSGCGIKSGIESDRHTTSLANNCGPSVAPEFIMPPRVVKYWLQRIHAPCRGSAP